MKRCRLLALVVVATIASAFAPAADNRPVVPLWSKGAPGSEARKGEPEKVAGSNVSNIHHPSLTVYLPAKEKATGAAVIPLYPEDRDCAAPSASRVLEIFNNVARHHLKDKTGNTVQIFKPALTPLQRQLHDLHDIEPTIYAGPTS